MVKLKKFWFSIVIRSALFFGWKDKLVRLVCVITSKLMLISKKLQLVTVKPKTGSLAIDLACLFAFGINNES